MHKNRKSSIDNVEIKDWRWKPFLDKSIIGLNSLSISECSIPQEFLDKEVTLGAKKDSSAVQISTWAARSTKIKYARAACLEAKNIGSVFNFVVTPLPVFDLPFLGADFVTLPTGHLLALDLQPALQNDILHTEKVWKKLIPIKEKWMKYLPKGGDIPSEAKPYFSPGFLWTRIPLGKEGDELISDIIEPAFSEYLHLFLDILSKAKPVSFERSEIIERGQKKYFKYRAEKDPARGMLNKFFGIEWTEEYINKILFNIEQEKVK